MEIETREVIRKKAYKLSTKILLQIQKKAVEPLNNGDPESQMYLLAHTLAILMDRIMMTLTYYAELNGIKADYMFFQEWIFSVYEAYADVNKLKLEQQNNKEEDGEC